MDKSKIIIKFDTSYVDRENKLHIIDNYIRDFLDQYFTNFEIEENIQILLSDNIHKTKRRIDKGKGNDTDNSIASTIYLDGQFFMVLPIGGFALELFPEEAKNYPNERLAIKQIIYHEMQHIKNRYDHPILAQILDNTSDISNKQAYFKFSACKFIDEYLATANSQSLFRTETVDKILLDFNNLYRQISKNFSKKELTLQDVNQIAYFYSHIFAIAQPKIMKGGDELQKKIEEKLDGIEKRFFININNAIEKYLTDKDIKRLLLTITRIMNDFYKLGSNPRSSSLSL